MGAVARKLLRWSAAGILVVVSVAVSLPCTEDDRQEKAQPEHEEWLGYGCVASVCAAGRGTSHVGFDVEWRMLLVCTEYAADSVSLFSHTVAKSRRCSDET